MTGSQPGPTGPETGHAPMIHMPTAHPDGPLPGPERPGGYNTPRRLSNGSTSSVTSSVVSGHDSSFDGRVRAASVTSSQTSVDSYSPRGSGGGPVTWQTQNGGAAGQNYPWQRPAPIKQRRKAQPGELFAALPGEVLELILGELRKLHLEPGSSSCATCWMRDCCAVAVSARKFVKYAREALYQHVHLVGHEGPAMKKRTKTTYGSRLVLLRRTLRANAHIAVIVRSLKPPARPLSVGAIAYNDLVASVVMACPNLERLVGYYPTYDHSFQRVFQALSTRTKLKDMNWILEPSVQQRQLRTRSPAHNDRWGPADLQPQESQLYMGFHANWRQLTTLVVHCQPGAALSPANLLECTIRSLPSLQNLYLSHLPPTTFNDTHLLALPPLKTLSLSYCTGVTTAGLSSLATRRTSASIQTLTLLHMNVESLPAIARIFSYLTALQTFTIVQTFAPEMPPDEFIMLFPYLASQSIRKLHWDIPYLPDTSTPADGILSRSISAGGFPALRSLCTPNDPEGLFQSLCMPRERIDHPADRYQNPTTTTTTTTTTPTGGRGSALPWSHTRNNSSFSSTRTGGSTSNNGGGIINFRPGSSNGTKPNLNTNTPPESPMFPPADALIPRANSNLVRARLAAQTRLEAARRVPRYAVRVADERGVVVESFAVGAFLGRVESRVRYVLAADVGCGASDEGGGVVAVEDLVREDGGEMVGLLSGDGDGGDGGKGGKKSRRRGGGGGVDRDGESDVEGAGGGNKGRREGCVGRWNTFSGVVVDKKDKERWGHQERGRWRALVLT
ncbi:uncharacterized protein B0H64DRAFT_318620 [Chaetomium fimeti]|uniref:Uncharacterized protein n=1 Tax=Chaetomium fimeti TaxID=1854472 RepID=A0AAE0HM96_9PEZI|nr:hypothetical protein B0H64DRAFT_318620 [Chaetomium fimeti]